MGVLIYCVILFSCLAAWLTHIVDCIAHGFYGLLIAGALFFPIGIVHGFGVWAGVWN